MLGRKCKPGLMIVGHIFNQGHPCTLTVSIDSVNRETKVDLGFPCLCIITLVQKVNNSINPSLAEPDMP